MFFKKALPVEELNFLWLFCYQQRRKEKKKLERWSTSLSFSCFFPLGVPASSIFVLLLPVYLLFVFLLISNPVFCLLALLSFPSLCSRRNILSWVEEGEKEILGIAEELVVRTKAVATS